MSETPRKGKDSENLLIEKGTIRPGDVTDDGRAQRQHR